MLSMNSTYTFSRRADGTTHAVSIEVSIYKESTVPTKKHWVRDDGVPTEIDIPNYSSLTPLETMQFSYTIPLDLQTSATEVDRSSNADTPLGDFEKNFWVIKNNTKDDATYTSLWDKYQPTHGSVG